MVRGGAAARALTSAGGAVLSQSITAGGSLILQVVAARELGAGGFAAFALLFATVVTVTTAQTAWVGDSLTVLDRFDQRTRAALAVSVLAFLGIGASGGAALALVLDLLSPTGIVLFSLLIVLWLIEETGRRLLSARLEFGRLAANDGTYVMVTVLALLIVFMATRGLTLEWILAAMCLGCVAAILLALAQLPAREYAPVSLRGADLGGLGAFASWRCAQAGLRPLTLLVARIAIATLVSRSALAAIEAARLLLTPTLTLINGIGGFLLPTMVRRREAGEPLRARLAIRACVLLGGVSAVTGLAAIATVDLIGPLITGSKFPVDAVTVGGWAVYAVSFSATLPLALLATAYRMSRLVFVVRGLETLTGLVALFVLLAWRPHLAAWAPYVIGAGGIVSSAMLLVRFRSLRGSYPIT